MGKFGEKGVVITVVFGEADFSRDSSEMEQPRTCGNTPKPLGGSQPENSKGAHMRTPREGKKIKNWGGRRKKKARNFERSWGERFLGGGRSWEEGNLCNHDHDDFSILFATIIIIKNYITIVVTYMITIVIFSCVKM